MKWFAICCAVSQLWGEAIRGSFEAWSMNAETTYVVNTKASALPKAKIKNCLKLMPTNRLTEKLKDGEVKGSEWMEWNKMNKDSWSSEQSFVPKAPCKQQKLWQTHSLKGKIAHAKILEIYS